MATAKLNKMANVWKRQCLDKKIRVLKGTVFPTATYGCEAWTIKKTGQTYYSFWDEMLQKILRILWTDRVTNEKVLEKAKMNSTTLLHEIRKLKVWYFGHIEHHDLLKKAHTGSKGGRQKRKGEDQWGCGNKIYIQDWLETTTQAGRMAKIVGISQENPRSNVLKDIS